MIARPMTVEEVAVVIGWLRFNREAMALKLEETPRRRRVRRKALRANIATLDALLHSLEKEDTVEQVFAERVAARAARDSRAAS